MWSIFHEVSPVVHTLLSSVLQRLDYCGVEDLILDLILEKVLNFRYDLIIGPILLPIQVCFVCLFYVGEHKIVGLCQIRSIVLVKQDSLRQFSRPFCLYGLSQLPRQDGIAFPIDSFAFLKEVNEHNALCIPEVGVHDFPCRWHHLGFLWRGEEECAPLHGLSYDLLLEVVDPAHSLWVGKRLRKLAGSSSKSAKFAYDMTSLVCFWSGVKTQKPWH